MLGSGNGFLPDGTKPLPEPMHHGRYIHEQELYFLVDAF